MPQAISTDTVPSSARGNAPSRLDLRSVRNATLLIVSVAVLLQLTLFFSTDNLAASALLLCGAAIGLSYTLDRQLLIEYPLSTLAILGYTVSYFVIPPLGQLADFHGILHNLHHHILVWAYGVAGVVAVIVAHYLYRVFSLCSTVRLSIARFLYRPLHFFEMPNTLQFWLMGFIGVGATVANLHIAHRGTALISVMRVLEPLLYIPYFMVFPEFLDPRYRIRRRPLRFGLIAYTGLVIVVFIMTNSRGFMFTGFASLGVVYIYRVMTGTIAPPKLTMRSSIILAVSVWIISGPATNMAASMVVARSLRKSVSPQELAVATWNAYRSGAAVRSVERWSNEGFHRYEETYYNNVFLDRLGNVRYTDISTDAVHETESLGELPYFRKIQIARVIAILPEPAIKALHIGIDKDKVLRGSSEDFLYTLATGSPVGGFKTDSPLVVLSATFGTLWPIFYLLLVILLFIFIDARTELIGTIDERENRRTVFPILNPVVAGTLFSYTSLFTAFGLQDIAAYIGIFTREAVEIALVYGLAFVSTKIVSSLVLGWMWRAAPQGGA